MDLLIMARDLVLVGILLLGLVVLLKKFFDVTDKLILWLKRERYIKSLIKENEVLKEACKNKGEVDASFRQH